MTIKRLFLYVTMLAVISLLVVSNGISYAAGNESSISDLRLLEEEGLEYTGVSKNPEISTGRNDPGDFILDTPVLLIPDSGTDVIGMYDPNDGTYLGDIITGYAEFQTPVDAVQGPDGNIYVSDQLGDAIFVFDQGGNYLYTYADATDGLNNIRGFDFRDGHLFVTSGDDYVAEFDGPHSRLPDFIADGSDPFDIYFLADGRALVADIQGTTDNIRLYNVDGSFAAQLFSVNFPEQIQGDLLLPGTHLNAAFSANVITDFDLTGTINQTTDAIDGRGVYRLGNGNLLVSGGTGVNEIVPGTGEIIEQERAISGRFIELFIPASSQDIPTLSEWGMILMALLLVLLGTIAVIRKRSLVLKTRA